MTTLKARLLKILGLFIGYFLLFLCLLVLFGSSWWWTLWNLFLALVPLCLSTLVVWLATKGPSASTGNGIDTDTGASPQPRSKATITWICVCSVVWVLTLPNAFYYLTDLLWMTPLTSPSLSGPSDGTLSGGSFRPENITDTMVWLPVMFIAMSAVIATIAGIFSIMDIHRIVRHRLSKTLTVILLAMLFLVNGFGIYIGRFLRLNSWDIVRPWTLLSTIIKGLNPFALEFSLMMAAIIAVIYCVFQLLAHHTTREIIEE
jgi:uncharacterized membrane protein